MLQTGYSDAKNFLSVFPQAPSIHWRQDDLLRDIDLDAFDLITLDVFDTLLMRRCHRPDEVFLCLGQCLVEHGFLMDGLSREAFRMARIAAESEARQQRKRVYGDEEIDLADIHAILKGIVKDPLESAALEFSVERELILPNPIVQMFLMEARKAGKTPLLLSDMYLGKARIQELLRVAGIEADEYSELLVSSDLKLAKYDGSLFRMLLDRPGAPEPGRILHIGDNPLADGSVPASLGIRTLHYTAITHPDAKLFAYEEIHSPGLLPELRSLRRAMWQQSSGDDPRKRFWHRFGCCVLGPFLDAYATWIVETCLASSIDRVVPMMRDGHTLAPLIQRAAQTKGVDLQVVPGWLSRRSVFWGAQPPPTAETLAGWFEIDTFTIQDLFENLDQQEIPEELQSWATLRLSQCAYHHTESGKEVRALLVSYLLSPGIQESLEAFIGKQRALLVEYLRGLMEGAKGIAFVDIGFSGSTGRAVHNVLQREGLRPKIVHLFAIGHVSLGQHLLAGMDARCYAGGFGRDWDIIQRFFRSSAFLEEMILGNHGSACGYERREDGSVSEIRDTPDIPLTELRCKAWCQEGIAQWQEARILMDEWLQPVSGAAPMMSSSTDMLRMLLRVVELPVEEEARFIGEITHDYGFGGGPRQRLCPDKATATLAELGPRLFLECTAFSYYTCAIPWPEGTVTLAEPRCLIERALRHGDGEMGLSNDFLAPALRLFAEEPGTCLIYGASQLGRQALRLLRLLDIPVAGFADRNASLWGTDICGVRVYSPVEARELSFQAVMIGSILHAESITQDVHSGVLGERAGLRLYSPFPPFIQRFERWIV
jgi:predicted HAD superfamily hydrolase